MGDFYGRGIPVASGFDLGSPESLDHRLVKSTIEQRNEIPVNILYDGISVYVEETKKDYRWIDGEWISNESRFEVDPDKFSKIVPISKGGTGASQASIARSNLGVPPINHASTQSTYGLASSSNYGHSKASSEMPLMDGVAAQGTKTNEFARGDHRHPTDTTRASVQSVQAETEARIQGVQGVQSSLQKVDKYYSQQVTNLQSLIQSLSSKHTKDTTSLQSSIQTVQYSLQTVTKNLSTQNTTIQGSVQSLTTKVNNIVQGTFPVSIAQSVQYPLKIGDKTYNGSQAVTISKDELLSWKSLQDIFASQGISLSRGSISTQSVKADNLVTYTQYAL